MPVMKNSQGSLFRPRFPAGFSLKLILFLFMAGLWAGLLPLFNNTLRMYHWDVVAYGDLTAILTLWILDGLDYFGTFSPIPEPDSMLTLAVAIPLAAAISKYVLLLITRLALIRYRDVLLLTLPICGIVYLVQVGLGLAFIRLGIRRKICFFTSEEESEKVLRALRAQKLLKYYAPIFLADLPKLPPGSDLAWVVISRSALRHFEQSESVLEAMIAGKEIVDYRELIARLRGHLDVDSLDLWMFLSMSVRRNTFGRIYYSTKTVSERILSAVLLAVLFPFLLLVALLVKLTSRGPAFFGQTRLGYRGRVFKVWKFRSMRQDAEAAGHKWSLKGDPRITRFGTFLRKTRIDELPQLWNVIRGEMSLIGPRPERPEFYDELEKEIPLFRFRLLVRPGITGWAQVMGGYAATVAQTKRKIEYDLYYLQRMSPKMDFIIAVRTLGVALKAAWG